MWNARSKMAAPEPCMYYYGPTQPLSDNCRMPQDASGKLGSIQTINQEIFMSWVYLAIAIAAEIVANTALKASHGFSGLYPSVITVVGYSLVFYFLALTLRVIPVGIAYAFSS